MTAFAFARPGLFARLAAALLTVAGITSCGSGAVGPVVVDPTRITILPDTATLYSGLPTTFTISGGTGSYIVSSSNQAVVQVSGLIPGNSLTIAPNPVLVDTTVTLTVRDTGTAPLATATLTVRPGTVNNNITITPSGTQGGACAPAVCSGGDALVTATLSQGGIPLPARGARMEVISGDFRFIVSPVGASTEVLATSVDVVSDEQGRVSARIRVLADAPNQTALLQVTDLGTGAFQRVSFLIAQATGTSPGFFVTPTAVTFTGPRADSCASNIGADFFVFGGAPPYTVSNTASNAFNVSADFVAASGGSFTVSARGVCVAEPGLPIVVRDSSGRTVTATVANIPGTAPVPPLVVAPSTVTLSDCTSAASASIAGGTGNYVVTSGSGAVIFNRSGNTISIRRNPNSPATTGPVSIGVTDGVSTATITVDLVGQGSASCPPGINASPPVVTVSDCTTAQTVALSGGADAYSAAPSSSSLTATVSGNIVNIKRANPSGAFSGGTVTVSDGFSTTVITVNSQGTGAGSCPAPLSATPPSITLTDCTTSQSFTVSGIQSLFFSVIVNGTSIDTQAVGGAGGSATIFVTRKAGSPIPTPPQSVSVSDGSSTVTVPVGFTGLAALACP